MENNNFEFDSLVVGDNQRNELVGTKGVDIIAGRQAADRIFGDFGDDFIFAGNERQ